MTPLEKAKAEEGRVNYCDECEQFKIVGNACYCKVDGKLIHPIMLARGQGTGPAWNCKKRQKPATNYELLIRKTPEELAEFITCRDDYNDFAASCPPPFRSERTCERPCSCKNCWLDWLRQEATDGEKD